MHGALSISIGTYLHYSHVVGKYPVASTLLDKHGEFTNPRWLMDFDALANFAHGTHTSNFGALKFFTVSSGYGL
jgi:hypothetical protein